MLRKLSVALVGALMLGTAGCSGLDDNSGSRALAGAGIGAGVGAGAGLLTGNVLGKAATGAAAGAAGGLVYDQYKKNSND